MSKKDTVNSGIATLDAANLTYEFEQDARKCCFYGGTMISCFIEYHK